jgi:two-component system OmpR family sensor kinase
MTLSLRARFALITGALVLAVASLAALGGYLAMRASLMDRAARSAAVQARQLTALVDVPASNGGERPAGQTDAQGAQAGNQANRVDITDPTLTHELATPGAVIEIARPNRTLIQARTPLGDHRPQLRASFTSRCLHAGRAATRLNVPPLSLACERVGTRAAPVATITVGASLSDALASLRTLRTALLIGVLGGALVSAGLAFVLARRALRPIGRIADTAESIRAGDLTQRIGYQRRDELGRLAAILDSCFAELEHALQRQRRFGADASHELRTPLAAIRANLELLRGWAAAEPSARQAAIASLDQASARATRIVEDLLYLARVEREPPAARVSASLDDLVLGAVREAQQLRPEVAIELTRLDEATVTGDALRLQQLLLNVLDNALRISPAGSTVTVELGAHDEQATITVSDEGPGIEPDQLNRIFERLYTERHDEGQPAGSGLGLAIARGIAENHGGSLSAHNNRGPGATFTLTLPLGHDRRPTPGPNPRETAAITGPRTSGA